jgi:uncharacterized protein YciI
MHRFRLFALFTAAFISAISAQAPNATYYLVFLRPHPMRTVLPKPQAERIQAAHMANIHKMAEDGVLVAAGPFADDPTTISGAFVFVTESAAAARKLADKDPTVVEHRNTVEVHTWSATPGIGKEYARLHKLDPKTPENMQPHPTMFLYHGPRWAPDDYHSSRLFQTHDNYLEQLKKEGNLGAVGHMDTSDDLFAVVVFKYMPMIQAQNLIRGDVLIQGGIIRVEEHTWMLSDHILP